MNNKISVEVIANKINEIEKYLGVKEPISADNIFSLVREGKVKEATKMIAQQLGLPIDINIIKVPNDYRAQVETNQFHTTQMVNVDKSGGSIEGITAQVDIPNSLPIFGSKLLINYPINVRVSENCINHPIVFVMILAHELSHILLYSLNNPQKRDEFYTDLTAIMLGFQDVYQNGRKITSTEIEKRSTQNITKTHTINYGYLNDEQFNFALDTIITLLENNRDRKKVASVKLQRLKKKISKYESTLSKFKYYFGCLSPNTTKKISGSDGKKISSFFMPGFTERYDKLRTKINEKQKAIDLFLADFSHYTEVKHNQLSSYQTDLEELSSELQTGLLFLKTNVKLLKRNIRLKYRLKIPFSDK